MVASSRWPLSGATIIGNLGGVANVCQASDQTLTRPNNATAYVPYQAIGSSSSVVFSFGDLANYPSSKGFFRQPNSTGFLTSLRCDVSGTGIVPSNMGSMIGWLYQSLPTAASGLVDQSAYPLLVADIGAFLEIGRAHV